MLGALVRDGGTAATLECSSHALVLERLAGCTFDVALFLNLSHEHLDFHGDMDEYFEAKARLFALLKPEGRAVVNLGDSYGRRLTSRLVAGRTVGFLLEGEEGAEQTRPAALAGAVALAAAAAGETGLFATVLGRATLGLAGTRLDVEALGSFTRALPDRRPLHHRFPSPRPSERREPPRGGRDRRRARLHARRDRGVALGGGRRPRPPRAHRERPRADDPRRLRAQAGRPRGRAEDGPPARAGGRGARPRRLRVRRRPRQGQASRHGPHRRRARGRRRRDVRQPALRGRRFDHRRSSRGGAGREAVVVLADRRAAIAEALRGAGRGDVVLVAGKGHETSQVIGGVEHPFDDRAVVRELLAGGGGR